MFKRFSVGFAAGYVLGARAGQKRYEQITDLADRVVKMPGVNRLAEQASDVFTPENGRHLLQNVMDRARSMGSGSESESDDEYEDYDDQDYEDEDADDEDVDDDEDEDVVDEDDSGDADDVADDEDGVVDDDEDERDTGARPHRRRMRTLASAAMERGRVD